MKNPIAGGAGSAARVEVALPHPRTAQRRALERLLENERLLAFALLSPTVILLSAFIAYPLQVVLLKVMPGRVSPVIQHLWPMPGVGWTGLAMCVGGMAGVVVAYALLRAGRLRHSFAD